MSVHSIRPGGDAGVRRIVLRILECGEPVTLHEIAHAASHHFHRSLSCDEIHVAVSGLRKRGHSVMEYDDGVAVEYWLDVPGDAA